MGWNGPSFSSLEALLALLMTQSRNCFPAKAVSAVGVGTAWSYPLTL